MLLYMASGKEAGECIKVLRVLHSKTNDSKVLRLNTENLNTISTHACHLDDLDQQGKIKDQAVREAVTSIAHTLATCMDDHRAGPPVEGLDEIPTEYGWVVLADHSVVHFGPSTLHNITDPRRMLFQTHLIPNNTKPTDDDQITAFSAMQWATGILSHECVRIIKNMTEGQRQDEIERSMICFVLDGTDTNVLICLCRLWAAQKEYGSIPPEMKLSDFNKHIQILEEEFDKICPENEWLSRPKVMDARMACGCVYTNG